MDRGFYAEILISRAKDALEEFEREDIQGACDCYIRMSAHDLRGFLAEVGADKDIGDPQRPIGAFPRGDA